MGGNQSTPSSSSNPNSPSATTMPSSNSPSTTESKPQSELFPEPEQPASQTGAQGSSDPPPPSEVPPENSEIKEGGGAAEGEEEDEDKEECGFCIFMKGGGCAKEFTAWEKCVDEGDRNNEDIAEKCFELTSALKKCMEAHQDYYAPILDAEAAAHERAKKEFEEEEQREKEKEKEGVTQVDESATAANNSDKGGVLSVSEQGIETRDSVSSPSEQEKN
ncbi:OLC1v1032734C1 [Oldenlandia corymbosa var. corymbosa]|uniref:OLC1v1032734C1 n=1 Tax=Oldenlandia corymbosa var. corymbosa TaxID=529605 RepID=A0AAV1CNI3_OLDCO|nr:OLC1v1032734C1 [Oldenlandia corymbosa var. corymbosa]